MVLAPLRDPDMPASGVDALLEIVTPVYPAAQQAARFRVYRPDDGHVFRVKYFEWMVQFFRSSLPE